MADIMDEITDDLRQQKLKAFWQENRYWILGGAVMAVVMTASLTFWREYSFERNVAATAVLSSAVQTGDTEKLMTYAKEAGTDHAALARFEAAGLFLKKGESDKAVAAFNEIAAMRGVDKDLRGLATLYSILQRLDVDDAKKLEEELQPLLSKDATWRFSAMEALALLQARNGKPEQAIETLTLIAGDAAAPQNLKSRALTLRELYAGAVPKK